jgi:hypothetical protein
MKYLTENMSAAHLTAFVNGPSHAPNGFAGEAPICWPVSGLCRACSGTFHSTPGIPNNTSVRSPELQCACVG